MMTETVLVAAGGTGGHVFPGLATAAALRRMRPDLRVEFVGTKDRLESELVPQAGYTLHTVPAMAWSRTLDLDTLKLPWVVGQAVRQVKAVIDQRRVTAAVGFGGYTSVPLAVAAKLTATPLVIHEQNAVVGVANKAAGRVAQAVAVTFDQTSSDFGNTPTVVTGNPVRPDLIADHNGGAGQGVRDARLAVRPSAYAALGLDPGRRTLLVFGGSQGARTINDALTASICAWDMPGSLQILHAAGRRTYAETRCAYQAAGVDLDRDADPAGLKVVCTEFLDRMDLAYAAADVVVCRAGASSIAELTALAIPALLVPYPFATADHQTANARAVADRGGAIAIADEDMSAEQLVCHVQPLLEDDEYYRRMRDASAAFGRPHAATELSQLILDVADAGANRS